MTSPLQTFKQEHLVRWNTLQDVPPWEADPIIEWIIKVFGTERYQDYRSDIIRQIETKNRILLREDLGIEPVGLRSLSQSLMSLLNSKEYGKFVTFLDCVVQYVRDHVGAIVGHVDFSYSDYPIDQVLGTLEICLSNGSKWQVVFERNSESGLIERVDERITSLAKELKNDHLTNAWNNAFSVNPEPDKAIELAQKAVEQTATENGLTNSKTKIYGTLLGDIKANPGNYETVAKSAYDLSFKLSSDPRRPIDPNLDFANWFWLGMDLVQKSNPGRHASTDTKEFALPADAGKQSVLISTIICQLIGAGYFKKKK